jgi:hypothetical protein
MAANYYLELDKYTLVNFANGTAHNGQSVAASPTPIVDVGPALTYLDSLSWFLVFVGAGPGGHLLYILKNNH